MIAMDQAFQDAAALGVSVCSASGDSGSGDGVNDKLAHVDFPASSPFALACGGTRLTAAGTTIAQETVWNEPTGGATGGGVSDQFSKPAYQARAHVPPSINPGHRVGRGMPDIAGDADPQTGYIVRVDGKEGTIGGTSAVAPLWAGLIAILNQKLPKPLGFVNPLLYTVASAGLHDITSGNNGQYQAGAGWDACTGWGSPDGARLLKLLAGS
jgi:kumamolisin